jgi:hypothetical protein
MDKETMIEKHYLITLIDFSYGSSLREIEHELCYFEEQEMYEVCSAIKKAVDFIKVNNLVDIRKEILSLSIKLQKEKV